MPIDFYQRLGSAPCRAVALTVAAVGVDVNFKDVNLMAGEQMKPEYLKMNPQHTVPTIDDNGFYLWESRAIMTYLVEQYAKNDSLYPKDPKKRAIVNQMLYFDACTLYKAFGDYYYPTIFAKAPHDQQKFDSISTAFTYLDKFLEGEEFVAGKTMTVADLAIVASVSTFDVMEYDLSKFKNVSRWYAKIKSVAPKYEQYNAAGIKQFKELVDSLKK